MENKPLRLRTFNRRISHLLGPLIFYRTGRLFYLLKLSPLSEVLRYLGIFFFHCDISYKAKLGDCVSFPHYGLGTVVGKYVVMGNECVIMPGALIGATLRDHRMPTFEDGVVVGAGAKILGDITIGKCAVIAANSVVTDSIPPYALVAGNPARIINAHISPDQLAV